MTGSRPPVDVLVVDSDGSLHGSYDGLLSGVAARVVTVTPGEGMRAQLRSGGFGVVIIRTNGTEADRVLDDIAAIAKGSAPAVVVLSQQLPNLVGARGVDRGWDFVPLQSAADLLPQRVSCLLELARLKSDITTRDLKIEALAREGDLLRVTIADERRAAAALSQRVGEQIHRSKNLLAILQSVARRTVHDGRSITDARDALMRRLASLSRAYHMVSASNGTGTDVAHLVGAELADMAERVTINGPSVRLASSTVQTFTLAVHELAANAVQHGALKSPNGKVVVGWTFFECGPDRYLEVAWTERGGEPVTAPEKFGFGLSLVSSFAGPSAAAPNVTFDDHGFSCRIRLAQEALVGG